MAVTASDIEIIPIDTNESTTVSAGKDDIQAVEPYEMIRQAPEQSWFEKAYRSFKSVFGGNEHPYNFVELVAHEEGKSPREVLEEVNGKQAVMQHELRAVVSSLFEPVTPTKEIEPYTIGGSISSAIANLVGTTPYIAAPELLGARFVSKLPVVANMVEKAPAFVKDAINLGLVGSLHGIIENHSKTNDIFLSLEEGAKEGLEWMAYGAVAPVLGEISNLVIRGEGGAWLTAKRKIFAAISAIYLSETAQKKLTGTNDWQLMLENPSPEQIAQSLFNIGMVGLLGASSNGLRKGEAEGAVKSDFIDALSGSNKEAFAEVLQDLHKVKEGARDVSKTVDLKAVKQEVEAGLKTVLEKPKEDIASFIKKAPVGEEKPVSSVFEAVHDSLLKDKVIKARSGVSIEDIAEVINKEFPKTADRSALRLFMTPQFLRYEKGAIGEAFKKGLDVFDTVTAKANKIMSDIYDNHFSRIVSIVTKDKELKQLFDKFIVMGDKLKKNPVELFKQSDISLPEDKAMALETAMLHFKVTTDKLLKIKMEAIEEGAKNLKLSDKVVSELKRAYADFIDKWPYYFMRVREPGNIKINVYDIETGKKVHMITEHSFAYTLTGRVPRKTIEKVRKLFPDKEKYDIKVTEIPPNDISKSDPVEVISWLANHADEYGYDTDEINKIVGDVIDALKAQGGLSVSIHRSRQYITGFETDVIKALGTDLEKTTGFITKAYMKNALMEIEKEIPPGEIQAQKIFSAWRKEVLRSKDGVDLKIGKLRAIEAVRRLGGMIRPIFVNLLQTPVWNTSLLAEHVPLKDAHAITYKAANDVIKKAFSEEEKELMSLLEEHGVFGAQETRFMFRKSAGNVSMWWKIGETLMKGFSKSEEFNRMVSGLSFIRVLKDKGQLPEDPAVLVQTVRNFVELVHGRYGDTNLPAFLLGGDNLQKVGRLGYTFQAYNVSMFQNILRMMKNKEVKPLVNLLAMTTVFGGIRALPFVSLVDYLSGKFTGKSLLEQLKSFLGYNPATNKIVDGGLLSYLTGVDVSGSIELTTPIGAVRYSGDFADFATTMVLGVFWADIKDVLASVDNIRKGNWVKALEKGMPLKFLSYPIKALREYRTGFTTSGEVLMYDPKTGKKMDLTAKEAVLTAMGFTPERVAEFNNFLSFYKTIASYYSKERYNIYTQVRHHMLTGDMNGLRKDYERAKAYNQQLINLKLYGVFPLADIRRAARYKASDITRMMMLYQRNMGGK